MRHHREGSRTWARSFALCPSSLPGIYNESVMKISFLVFLFLLPVFPQTAAESSGERGWTVLEAALQAAGGRQKLAAVKDMTFELQSHLVTPEGKFDVRSRNFLVLPDTVRQDMTLPFGEMTVAFNQSGGWRKGPKGVDPIPVEQLRLTLAHLARVNTLFKPPEDRATVRWLEAATVNGRTCDVIETTHLGGDPLRLFIDRENKNVIKRSYNIENPGGGHSQVEEMLSDFREVEGLRLSFKVQEIRNGKLARESTTHNLKINTGLKAQDLLREFKTPQ